MRTESCVAKRAGVTCPLGLYSGLESKVNVASLGFLDGTELDMTLDDYYRQLT